MLGLKFEGTRRPQLDGELLITSFTRWTRGEIKVGRTIEMNYFFFHKSTTIKGLEKVSIGLCWNSGQFFLIPSPGTSRMTFDITLHSQTVQSLGTLLFIYLFIVICTLNIAPLLTPLLNLIHGMSQNSILGLKITFSLEMFFSFVRNNVCGL